MTREQEIAAAQQRVIEETVKLEERVLRLESDLASLLVVMKGLNEALKTGGALMSILGVRIDALEARSS